MVYYVIMRYLQRNHFDLLLVRELPDYSSLLHLNSGSSGYSTHRYKQGWERRCVKKNTSGALRIRYLGASQFYRREALTEDEVGKWVRSLIDKGDLHAFYVSTAWLHLRAEVLEEHKSECQECKKKGLYTKANHVHHVQYVRRYPELALSKTYTYKGKEYNNLIPVCKDCHETVCHPERLRWNRQIEEPLTVEMW